MEGLENTITVMLVFGGAAAFLWTIDKVLGLFGKYQETKLRYSSKLPYFLIGITIIGVVFALHALDDNRGPSSRYSDDNDGYVGSMRC